MDEITKSATRLSLLAAIATLCVASLVVIIRNSDKSEVVTQIISLMSNVTVGIVTYYFTDKRTKDKSPTE